MCSSDNQTTSFSTLISVTNSLLQLSAILLTAFLALIAGISGKDNITVDEVLGYPTIVAVWSFVIAILACVVILLNGITDLHNGRASVEKMFYRIAYGIVIVAVLSGIFSSAFFLYSVPRLVGTEISQTKDG